MKTALRMLLYPRNTSNQEKTFILIVKTDDFFCYKIWLFIDVKNQNKVKLIFFVVDFCIFFRLFSFLFTSRSHARVRKLVVVHKRGPSVDVVERTLRFRIASGRIPGWRKSADVFVPRSLRRLSPRERKNVLFTSPVGYSPSVPRVSAASGTLTETGVWH